MLHRFEWNAAQNKRSSNYQMWTHENHPEEIFAREFFDQKLDYIHQNPVRAGIVAFAEDYVYSSARALMKNIPGPLPLRDWCS